VDRIAAGEAIAIDSWLLLLVHERWGSLMIWDVFLKLG
jgi:hypothetical protein